jgi:hypothetical protein
VVTFIGVSANLCQVDFYYSGVSARGPLAMNLMFAHRSKSEQAIGDCNRLPSANPGSQ